MPSPRLSLSLFSAIKLNNNKRRRREHRRNNCCYSLKKKKSFLEIIETITFPNDRPRRKSSWKRKRIYIGEHLTNEILFEGCAHEKTTCLLFFLLLDVFRSLTNVKIKNKFKLDFEKMKKSFRIPTSISLRDVMTYQYSLLLCQMRTNNL